MILNTLWTHDASKMASGEHSVKKILNVDLSDRSSDDNEDNDTSEGHISDCEDDTVSQTSRKRKRDVFPIPSGTEAGDTSSESWEASVMKYIADEKRRTAVRAKMNDERRAQLAKMTEKFPPSKRRKLK